MAKWDTILSRGRVDDRRGTRTALGGGLGVVGIAAVILINILSNGQVDLSPALEQLQQAQVPMQSIDAKKFEGSDDYEVFAATVLGSTNDVWNSAFSQGNKTYEPPLLVLFRQATSSSCGMATSAVGPHYCPLDETIYLDETFFDELTTRFGAQGGDVAQAYVIAHEVGHHVQHELGIMEQVQTEGSNTLSIKLELQADCFAGLWASSIKDRGVFEPGEIKEAIDAAAAVGDDRIQEKVTGRINPETWTHGSSVSRMEWFNKGYDTGSFASCNTFE